MCHIFIHSDAPPERCIIPVYTAKMPMLHLVPLSDEVRLYTSTSHSCGSMWTHFIHTRRYVRTKFTMGYFSIIDMYIRESAEETISMNLCWKMHCNRNSTRHNGSNPPSICPRLGNFQSCAGQVHLRYTYVCMGFVLLTI